MTPELQQHYENVKQAAIRQRLDEYGLTQMQKQALFGTASKLLPKAWGFAKGLFNKAPKPGGISVGSVNTRVSSRPVMWGAERVQVPSPGAARSVATRTLDAATTSTTSARSLGHMEKFRNMVGRRAFLLGGGAMAGSGVAGGMLGSGMTRNHFTNTVVPKELATLQLALQNTSDKGTPYEGFTGGIAKMWDLLANRKQFNETMGNQVIRSLAGYDGHAGSYARNLIEAAKAKAQAASLAKTT